MKSKKHVLQPFPEFMLVTPQLPLGGTYHRIAFHASELSEYILGFSGLALQWRGWANCSHYSICLLPLSYFNSKNIITIERGIKWIIIYGDCYKNSTIHIDNGFHDNTYITEFRRGSILSYAPPAETSRTKIIPLVSR